MIRKALAALSVAALIAAGCATQNQNVFVGFFAPYKNCRARYAEIDARVDAAGVRDASYYRVPGYPYFRTDRVLASFRNEVHTLPEISGWIRRMREFDQEAREYEYINLGLTTQERASWRSELVNCGHGLAGIELDDTAALDHLRILVKPSDDYSDSARIFGVYPLAVPVLKQRIEKQQNAIRQDASRPIAELDSPGPLTLWKVKPSENLQDDMYVSNPLDKAILDELGFPGLTDSQWHALAELNAPQIWMETGVDQDRMGAPAWSKEGKAVVDVSKPQMNWQITFTRFGDQRLGQIVYYMWFPDHADKPGEAAGTNIDGMIWRVTLDQHAKPLVYESMRASGADHRWFPVQASLKRRDDANYWHQPQLFPQEKLPDGVPVLRLQSGSHMLRQIVADKEAVAARTETFELQRYEDLLTLAKPDGTWRNLFGPDGLIPGTHGSDPIWLAASGISNPGALRELGHHVIDYVGRREFDDPFILEAAFLPPPPGPVAAAIAEPAAPPAIESLGGL